MRSHPGDGQGCRGYAQALSELCETESDSACIGAGVAHLVVLAGEHAPLFWRMLARVLAAEQACGQRAVGKHADLIVAGHRQKFYFGLALE